MRREDQHGIYGFHNDLEDVVEIIKENPRGITRQELQEETGFQDDKMRIILVQADAVGKIVVEGGGKGRGQARYFYTDHQNLHYNSANYSTEEIKEKVNEAIDRLADKGEENGDFRISIQKV